MSPVCDVKMFITSKKTYFQKAKNKIGTGHQSSFFPDCIAEGCVLRKTRPVEDILPSFTLVIALESLTAEQQKYLLVIVTTCTLAFDPNVLQCMSLSLTCLLPRLLLQHETFKGSSWENFRSRIRGKSRIYQMIPSMLSHSSLPPTQENNHMPCALPMQGSADNLTFLCRQSNAIKCPTAGFGDSYKG